MTGSAAATKLPTAPRRPVEHDLLLAALPYPIIVLPTDNRIVYANTAAEAFFSTGIALLKRTELDEIVGFGCPLIALLHQVRRFGSTVNEYSVEITGLILNYNGNWILSIFVFLQYFNSWRSRFNADRSIVV